MINEKIFLGLPIDFQGICKIYPPTVNDVCGDPDFPVYQSMLTITYEDLEDAFMDKTEKGRIPTPFEYLMVNCYADRQFLDKALDAFEKFLHEPVAIIPELQVVIIGKREEDIVPDEDLIEPRLLEEKVYFDFQNKIREAFGEKPAEKPNLNEHWRIREHKAKLRHAEKMREKAKKNAKTSLTIGTVLAAVCCMGIGINPLNIGEMSYACISWLISMNQQKESYETDIKSLLAGADRKKVKPKYWIRNLNEEKY